MFQVIEIIELNEITEPTMDLPYSKPQRGYVAELNGNQNSICAWKTLRGGTLWHPREVDQDPRWSKS